MIAGPDPIPGRVFRFDGVEKMFDKYLESHDNSDCRLKLSHRHILTSILNG